MSDARSFSDPEELHLLEYAKFLGYVLPEDADLLWIAQEGLRASLPPNWRRCRTAKGEDYYYNLESGRTQWEHPYDEYFKLLFTLERERKKSGSTVGSKEASRQRAAKKSKWVPPDSELMYSPGRGSPKKTPMVVTGKKSGRKASPTRETPLKSPTSEWAETLSSQVKMNASKWKDVMQQEDEEERQEYATELGRKTSMWKEFMLERDAEHRREYLRTLADSMDQWRQEQRQKMERDELSGLKAKYAQRKEDWEQNLQEMEASNQKLVHELQQVERNLRDERSRLAREEEAVARKEKELQAKQREHSQQIDSLLADHELRLKVIRQRSLTENELRTGMEQEMVAFDMLNRSDISSIANEGEEVLLNAVNSVQKARSTLKRATAADAEEHAMMEWESQKRERLDAFKARKEKEFRDECRRLEQRMQEEHQDEMKRLQHEIGLRQAQEIQNAVGHGSHMLHELAQSPLRQERVNTIVSAHKEQLQSEVEVLKNKLEAEYSEIRSKLWNEHAERMKNIPSPSKVAAVSPARATADTSSPVDVAAEVRRQRVIWEDEKRREIAVLTMELREAFSGGNGNGDGNSKALPKPTTSTLTSPAFQQAHADPLEQLELECENLQKQLEASQLREKELLETLRHSSSPHKSATTTPVMTHSQASSPLPLTSASPSVGRAGTAYPQQHVNEPYGVSVSSVSVNESEQLVAENQMLRLTVTELESELARKASPLTKSQLTSPLWAQPETETETPSHPPHSGVDYAKECESLQLELQDSFQREHELRQTAKKGNEHLASMVSNAVSTLNREMESVMRQSARRTAVLEERLEGMTHRLHRLRPRRKSDRRSVASRTLSQAARTRTPSIDERLKASQRSLSALETLAHQISVSGGAGTHVHSRSPPPRHALGPSPPRQVSPTPSMQPTPTHSSTSGGGRILARDISEALEEMGMSPQQRKPSPSAEIVARLQALKAEGSALAAMTQAADVKYASVRSGSPHHGVLNTSKNSTM
jgi:hypothetical protein